MTLEDIKRVQEKFIAAAIRCKKAGYDGVELHGAHSYLIAQFFSKYYNRRTDAYGGSLENRCRFIDEIIAGIRAKLGRYPISVRICGDEMTDEPGFLTLEDGLEIGRHLGGPGHRLHQHFQWQLLERQRQLRALLLHPRLEEARGQGLQGGAVHSRHRHQHHQGPGFRRIFAGGGVSDFVALGRSQFADPEFMNKARAASRRASVSASAACTAGGGCWATPCRWSAP